MHLANNDISYWCKETTVKHNLYGRRSATLLEGPSIYDDVLMMCYGISSTTCLHSILLKQWSTSVHECNKTALAPNTNVHCAWDHKNNLFVNSDLVWAQTINPQHEPFLVFVKISQNQPLRQCGNATDYSSSPIWKRALDRY